MNNKKMDDASGLEPPTVANQAESWTPPVLDPLAQDVLARIANRLTKVPSTNDLSLEQRKQRFFAALSQVSPADED
jgi:hypothetical protein